MRHLIRLGQCLLAAVLSPVLFSAHAEQPNFVVILVDDAGLMVFPYYNKPNPAGLRGHVQACCAVGLPVVLYHVPGRTGQRLAAPLLAELCNTPGVVALKEATGDVALGQHLLERLDQQDQRIRLLDETGVRPDALEFGRLGRDAGEANHRHVARHAYLFDRHPFHQPDGDTSSARITPHNIRISVNTSVYNVEIAIAIIINKSR